MANQALQRALQAVLAEIQKAEGSRLTGANRNVVEVKAEVEPADTHEVECAACEAGECADPDHMDDSSLNEMAGAY